MIFVLLVFVVGFFVCLFGVVFFGSFGDCIGCKYIFLVMILIMGILIFLVGVLFNYVLIGFVVLVILIVLCLVQGLVMGGEYGGVVIYVVEYVLVDKCGLYISFIQCIVMLGLFMLLLIILVCCYFLGNEVFEVWGWCILFLVLIVLLGILVWICLQFSELLLFQQMKVEGKGFKILFCDSFKGGNLKLMLLVLFGVVVGQVVVWYGGQFYVLFFLSSMFKVEVIIFYLLIVVVLVLGMLFFIFFGWLFDCIGCKKIILVGCLLVVVIYILVFKGLIYFVNLVVEEVCVILLVLVVVDLNICLFQFDLVVVCKFISFCDIVMVVLIKVGVLYEV